MKTKLGILIALLSFGVPALAHRLDEYLQAMIVSVEQTQIEVSMRLSPGVAVSSAVIAAIDSNGDGVFSEAEQQTYAREVLGDLTLSVDGHALKPRLQEVSFPAPADIKEGLGEIHIEFDADLPAGAPHRTLVIENHHEPRISFYLMNSLVPQDRNISVIAQSRNQNQSYFRLDYAQAKPQQDSLLSLWRSRLLTRLAPF
jgi:hypothetical protein